AIHGAWIDSGAPITFNHPATGDVSMQALRAAGPLPGLTSCTPSGRGGWRMSGIGYAKVIVAKITNHQSNHGVVDFINADHGIPNTDYGSPYGSRPPRRIDSRVVCPR